AGTFRGSPVAQSPRTFRSNFAFVARVRRARRQPSWRNAMMKRFVLGLTAVALLLSGAARARAEYIVTDLGTLGGHASSAVGINDAGQVVGTAFTSTGAYHAYLYSNEVMIDVNPPGTVSFGNGINASGQVVGYTGGRLRVRVQQWENDQDRC